MVARRKLMSAYLEQCCAIDLSVVMDMLSDLSSMVVTLLTGT